jgi:hypothetical protein
MRATDVLANTCEDFDPTYPSFGTLVGRTKLEFPEDLKDVKVGTIKSRLDGDFFRRFSAHTIWCWLDRLPSGEI